MVNLSIDNGSFILKDPSGQIFQWNHKSFFVVSLEFEVINGFYSTPADNLILEKVKEAISYLNDEKINFSSDEKVSKIISNLSEQSEEFDSVSKKITNPKQNDLPKGFNRKLKPYQVLGFQHLMNFRHGANFSVPGSGKTTMIYAYFLALKELAIVEKLVVVGPFSSFMPWQEEAFACLGYKIPTARLSGPFRKSLYLNQSDYELFLCHYQTAANDKEYLIRLCNQHKVLLVVDESHYIKRLAGGVWSESLLEIAPHAVRRAVLSGTPMPNGYLDLWSQLTFLWPGKQLLGERNHFRNKCDEDEGREDIKRDIRPFFFRVKKTDLDLPTPVFQITTYDLNPLQKQIYHALSIKLISDLNLQPTDRQKLKLWRKAKMIRLLQAASNPTLLTRHSEEFELPPMSPDGSTLIEIIEKYSDFEIPAKFVAAVALIKQLLSDNKKVVIWTSFIHNIKMLENMLDGNQVYSIHGAVPRDDSEDEDYNREKIISSFKSLESPAVLIANPAACAESISLHMVCHNAIYLDRNFNCGQYIQSLDRIHRIGLKMEDKITYHILIARDTIDETIASRLQEKKTVMEQVLEDELPIGTLDTDENEMEQTDLELHQDFEATILDVRKHLEKK